MPNWTKRPLADRIAEKTERAGPDECWLWRGALNNRGYGIVRGADSKLTTAHRAAFILAGGDPATPDVRHRCDTPACVNPAHLEPGSRADNMRDMVNRGRSCAGSRNAAAVLTEDIVRAIRARCGAGEAQRRVAADYGIRQPTVSDIMRGQTWTHVT